MALEEFFRLQQIEIGSTRVPAHGMQQCPYRRVQSAPHHAVARVDADVSPVIRPLRILNHEIAWLGILCSDTNSPLFYSRQLDSGLPVDPLHIAGTVPGFEGSAAPHISSAQTFLREPQNVLTQLAQVARRCQGPGRRRRIRTGSGSSATLKCSNDCRGRRLPTRIQFRKSRYLDCLSRQTFVHCLPTGNVQQSSRTPLIRSRRPAVEGTRVIGGIHKLLNCPPARRRTLLGRTDRVVVTSNAVIGEMHGRRLAGVREHAQTRLLQRHHDGDDLPGARYSKLLADRDVCPCNALLPRRQLVEQAPSVPNFQAGTSDGRVSGHLSARVCTRNCGLARRTS
ncbi:hypothetical protein QF047_002432 [Arthrobacter sp. W4I7]|nr:hypothetical protein [Arthrobacter sp. W4I7]